MTKPTHVMLDLETWGTRPGCEIRSIGACVFDPVEGWVAGMEVDGGDQPHPHTFYIATENPRGYYDSRGRAVPHWYNDPRGWETKYDLHRDPDTEAWWAEQSDEAQGAFHAVTCTVCDGTGRLPDYADLSEESGFVDCSECGGRGKIGNDPVDLKVGLERFTWWLHQVTMKHRPITNPSVIKGQYDAERGEYDMIDVRAHGVVHDQPVALNEWGGLRLWSHGAATDAPWLAAAYHACGLPVPWHYRAPRDTRTLFDLAGIDDHSAWLKQHPGPLGIAHHSLDDAICQARAVCAAWSVVDGWRASDITLGRQLDGEV